jgi:hypothetical protein
MLTKLLKTEEIDRQVYDGFADDDDAAAPSITMQYFFLFRFLLIPILEHHQLQLMSLVRQQNEAFPVHLRLIHLLVKWTQSGADECHTGSSLFKETARSILESIGKWTDKSSHLKYKRACSDGQYGVFCRSLFTQLLHFQRVPC